jgi:sterol desaturase/sphingolipid hydroxylase (fatty acid hydroxylase superfamily)
MLPYLLAVAAGCFLLERVFPGWPLPRVKSWPFRVIIVNLVQLGVVMLAGLSWERWLSSASVFRLRDHMSPAVGGMTAYFMATFIFYWWHRWRHRYDPLWRLFHQIHHSAQRIEVITSFYILWR